MGTATVQKDAGACLAYFTIRLLSQGDATDAAKRLASFFAIGNDRNRIRFKQRRTRYKGKCGIFTPECISELQCLNERASEDRVSNHASDPVGLLASAVSG